MRTIGLTAALLAACNGDKGEVTPTGETGVTQLCQNAVLEQYPDEGDADVHAWSSVDMTFSRAEEGASIEVTDGAGAVVPGAVEVFDGGKRIQWIPSQAMVPGAHTATLTWSCDPKPVSFDVGSNAITPVGDPSTLVDRTWILDIRTGRFVAPRGIGDALTELIEVNLLLGVRTADASTLRFVAGAEAEGGGQDLAAATTVFTNTAHFGDNPRFTVEQPSLDLVVGGDPLTVTDLSLEGSFDPDGTSIESFRLSGLLDTRQLKGALDIEDDNGVCELFKGAYSVDCEACPGGDGDLCITLVIADLTLAEAPYAMVDVP